MTPKGTHLPKHPKQRLDELVVQRGGAPTIDQARRLIMAGEVLVNGKVMDKPGMPTPDGATVEVRSRLPYVSRGGLKLAAALDDFRLDVTGLVAVDVGASTGGFTDCLLQRGVARVYAIDVGYGQLAWKLRSDPRVTVLDRTNVRHLTALPEGRLADLAVIDASFISLQQVLPATMGLLQADAVIVALVKPQFETDHEDVSPGGVVREPAIHRQVLSEMMAAAAALRLAVKGLTVSPAMGPAGNIEFLLWLQKGVAEVPVPVAGEWDGWLDQALAQAAVLVRERAARRSSGEK